MKGKILALLCAVFLLPIGFGGAFAQTSDLTHSVTIAGNMDEALRQEISQISTLARKTRSYTSLATIRRAARRDAQSIKNALTSKGYYAAEVVPTVTRAETNISVNFQIDLAAPFTITSYIIRYKAPSELPRPENFSSANISPAGKSDGEALQKLETALIKWLQNNGHPAARAQRRFVEADFTTQTARAIFEIESGPGTYFGDVIVNGAAQTKSAYVTAFVPWQTGAIYDQSKVIAYRNALQKTGLFKEISVSPAPAQNGRTDILLTLSERKRRTIGAGASFSTDVGPGGQLFWQNRNLRGQGETVTAKLNASTLEQSLELSVSRPLPQIPGDFSVSLKAGNEVTEAFDAQSVELASSLSRFFYDRKLQLSGGAGLTYSQIRDGGATDPFVYLTVPLNATWNNENDILNPTSGFRASATLTPYAGDINFLQTRLSAATRRAFGKEGRFIFATRGAIGSSFGINRDDIPSTERFFAGGGGSVRGFAFQEAGPLDENNDPLGGASLVEVNFEARANLRRQLQLAAFIDGGTVSDNSLPDFSEEVLWGAGLGLRYLTPVGPLRVDVATPLNPRATDDAVQLYISIGQPF